jgi:hypothetical protein
MRIIEELLEGKVAAPVLKTDINGRRDPLHFADKAAVARSV